MKKAPERKRILLKRNCQIDRISYEAGQVVEADARTIAELIAIGRGVEAPAEDEPKKPERKRRAPTDRALHAGDITER